MDDEVNSYTREKLLAMANANETLVRFQGDDYAKDITLNDTDKNAIKSTVEVYDLLVAAGYKAN